MKKWAERYQRALNQHLQAASPARPTRAAGLGRQALANGVGTLDLAAIHLRALIPLVSPPLNAVIARDGWIARAQTFFVEAITPIEQTHRLAMHVNVQLRQQTMALAAANRQLKQEVLRRRVAEDSLKQSQQHYRQLLERSRLMQDQLRHLSRQILQAQEEERKEISRELHDDIAQTLTGISVHLETLSREATANTQGLKHKITRTQRLVAKSVNIVHRFARELRPTLLDDLGLIPAIHAYLRDFTKRTGLRVGFTAFAGVEQLSGIKRTVLYRVTQAALTNAAQHAHATRANVMLRKLSGIVHMEIRDNGKGFDVERVLFARARNRLGLIGMRERVEMVGGTFTVESRPGAGTRLCAEIPFGNGAKGQAVP